MFESPHKVILNRVMSCCYNQVLNQLDDLLYARHPLSNTPFLKVVFKYHTNKFVPFPSAFHNSRNF